MNLERPQQICIAVIAIVLIAAGYVAYKASGVIADAKTAEQDADLKFDSLKSVYGKKVFPSKENISRLRETAEDLTTVRSNVAARLCKANIPWQDYSSSGFKAQLQKVIAFLHKKAPVVEGGKCVAPDFAFGFKEYAGETMPLEADTGRLSQQLTIISIIVNEMFEAKVAKILEIQREVFDEPAMRGVVDHEDSSSRSSRRSSRSASLVRKSSGGVASIVTPLFSAQSFAFTFNARQAALVDVLNRIAKARVFAVITDVTIEKTGEDVRPPLSSVEESATLRRRSRLSARDAEQAPVDVSEPEISELSPDKRLMSGPNLDPQLRVTIELDVYNFGKGRE